MKADNLHTRQLARYVQKHTTAPYEEINKQLQYEEPDRVQLRRAMQMGKRLEGADRILNELQ